VAGVWQIYCRECQQQLDRVVCNLHVTCKLLSHRGRLMCVRLTWSYCTQAYRHYIGFRTQRCGINGSPDSITERRVSELIPVLGSQPADDVSHKPGGRLPFVKCHLKLHIDFTLHYFQQKLLLPWAADFDSNMHQLRAYDDNSPECNILCRPKSYQSFGKYSQEFFGGEGTFLPHPIE